MLATLEEHKLFVYLAEYNLRLGQGHISHTYLCTEAVRSRIRSRSTVTSFRLQGFQKNEYISVDSRI
jgi:hypothetical protein